MYHRHMETTDIQTQATASALNSETTQEFMCLTWPFDLFVQGRTFCTHLGVWWSVLGGGEYTENGRVGRGVGVEKGR